MLSNQKQNYLILSTANRHEKLFKYFKENNNKNIFYISSEKNLTIEKLEKINPRYIFVPHWNKKNKKNIWSRWDTIIFHMTDLPYGRGGSPLQNLIINKKKSTFLTSLKCNDQIDAGPIYLKSNFALTGSAREIFKKVDQLIKFQITEIINKEIVPKEQEGEPTYFKRRTPSESNLALCQSNNLDDWYDFIRMLDADGYPNSYIELNNMKILFSDAEILNKKILAKVEIIAKDQLK